MSNAIRPVVMASAHGDGAKLALASYVDRPTFDRYRDAVVRAGARYAANIRANVIVIDRLAILKDALADAGFDLAIASDLRDALRDAADEAKKLADAGSARLREAEDRLERTGLSLYPYQRDGIRWLSVRRAALLADTMGLGKTIQVLMAVPPDARVLIIAPAAVTSNWVRECARWRPDLSPSIITGRYQWRWPRAGEMLVATYGSLPAEDQEFTQAPANIYLVADEAHMLKGSRGRKTAEGGYKGGTQRVRRWHIVRDAVDGAGGTTWLLTGTPLVNRPAELWRVLSAAGLATEAFGSYPRFAEMVGARSGRYGMVYDGDMSDELPTALQKVSLRRDREAVLPQLPRKVRQVDSVPLSDGDAIRMCDELVTLLRENGRDVDALANMGQMASDVRAVIFAMMSKIRAALAVAKIPALIERIEEYEEEDTPVVVFCSHLEPLRALAMRPGWGIIDGSVPAIERGETVAAFQDGRLKGIVCSYAAGGVGITLTRAHHVICVDLPWTPALLQQAEDRCCRIGQDADSVHVRVLTTDHPVDLRVAEIILEKASIIEDSVESSSREHIGLDNEIARRAETMADMAETTQEIAQRTTADIETDRAARTARERGEFAVGGETLGKFRPPANERETAIANALFELAKMDPDRAAEQNGAGFSKADNDIGHSLVESLVKYGRLSDKQWYVAASLAHKYRRQIGVIQ